MDRDRLLTDLAAKEEIRQAMARYSRGIDRRDEALLRTVYHEDSTDDHGFGLAAGGWEIAGLVRRDGKGFPDEWKLTSHLLGQHLIDVDGDSAVSEVYFVATNVIEHDGRDSMQVSSGRYLDRWERRDGSFKIAHRQVIYDWWRTDVNATPWPGPDHDVPKMFHGGPRLDESTNVYGVPGPRDKSYELLARLGHDERAAGPDGGAA